MLLSDGLTLRWQEGNSIGSVLLADIQKVLIGTLAVRFGQGRLASTYVRFVLNSGAECALPPNIASGLRAQSWRRLKGLMTHIRTVSHVPVEAIREPDIILAGWKDEPYDAASGAESGKVV